jgi:hypothetical protein
LQGNLQELRKIFIISIICVLCLFAAIIAITQESSDDFQDDYDEEEDYGELFDEDEENIIVMEKSPEWIQEPRWYRSNAAGMALEEVPSRLAALRNTYALIIDMANSDVLPEHLTAYYNDEFYIENRILFKDGKESRTQWIFRDFDGRTRLIAVFTEASEDAEEPVSTEELVNTEESVNTEDLVNTAEFTEESVNAEKSESDIVNEENTALAETSGDENAKFRRGFIEIYNEQSLLASEIQFYEDGLKLKTDFLYKEGIVISAGVFSGNENNPEVEYKAMYTDHYRYNRLFYLRFIERIYHRDQKIKTEAARVAFPNRVLETAKNDVFISEKLNMNPDFFGDLLVKKAQKNKFITDERGRIMTQTLYDDDEAEVWVITNEWEKDKIASIRKKEDGHDLLTEYEYDAEGNRIIERNFKDGVIERIVHSKNNRDTEELYINGIKVLVAVWEDGRKISETRERKN